MIHVKAAPRAEINILKEPARRAAEGDTAMMDIVMLTIGLGFFALTVGYAFACDRL